MPAPLTRCFSLWNASPCSAENPANDGFCVRAYIPVSIIRGCAKLPAPLPGQRGPFSLGGPGVLEETLRKAGFREVRSKVVAAPLKMPSAAECVRFEQESFGALHQMLSGLDAAGKSAAWEEISDKLRQFEKDTAFEGPCEMVVAVGTK